MVLGDEADCALAHHRVFLSPVAFGNDYQTSLVSCGMCHTCRLFLAVSDGTLHIQRRVFHLHGPGKGSLSFLSIPRGNKVTTLGGGDQHVGLV